MDNKTIKAMKRKKVIRVNSGTDIVIATPSHPLSVVTQIERMVNRVLGHNEHEFEFSCNSVEGLVLFQHYAELHKQILEVEFQINGTKSTFEESVSDLTRGMEYVERIIADKT